MNDVESIRFSVIVPVFCEAESLTELSDRTAAVFSGMGSAGSFEIVFVDDGSPDDTPDVITRLCAERPYVRVIRLRRNCGKSTALMAGFEYAKGNILITIDGDLQDHPEDIPKLLAKFEEGFDVVGGWRQKRKDTWTRRLGSRVYNIVVAWISGLRLHDHNCGLKAYSRRAASALCLYGHYHRYTPLLAHIVGFKVTEVPVENSPRRHGHSKYRTFRYEGLYDLLSISFTHKFGASPLHFFGLISLLFIVPSLGLLSYWAVRHVFFLMGYGEQFMLFPRPLLSLALIVLLMGVIIFLSGFICDFILHHLIRSNIKGIVDLQIEKITDNDGTEMQPGTRANRADRAERL